MDCEDGANPEGVVQGVVPGNEYLGVLGVTQGGGLHAAGTAFGIAEQSYDEVAEYWLDLGGTGGSPSGVVATFENSSGQSTLYFTGATGEYCPGRGNTNVDCGGLFSWNVTTGAETALHLFASADGVNPLGGVVVRTCYGLQPAIFGTTSSGGEFGWGTVWTITPAGEFNVLYQFTGSWDGGSPEGSVTIAIPVSACNASGKYALYGTTAHKQGVNGYGTLWSLGADANPNNFEVIYTFCSQAGCTDGASPTGPVLVQGSGTGSTATTYIYGTTTSGGAYGKGVVFEETIPTP